MSDHPPPFDFADCVRQLRSADPLTYEHAHAAMQPHVRRFLPQLLEELSRSPDAHTRGKFIELLGDAQAVEALPALTRELEHPDQNVRQWAVDALLRLCRPEADAAVAAYRRRHPEEFE